MKITVASQGPDITAAVALDHQPPRFWIIYDTSTHTYEVLDDDHLERRPGAPIVCSDPDELRTDWDRPVCLSEQFFRKLAGMSVGDVIERLLPSDVPCGV